MTDAKYLAIAVRHRPRTRGECRNEARPCPWVGCEHHLALDEIPATSGRRRASSLVLEDLAGGRTVLGERADARELDAFGDRVVDVLLELADTCSLDVGDRGIHEATEVATLARVTAGQVRRHERELRDQLRGSDG